MINVQEIRRNVINVVKNYSDAQVKVRKATSNEPWGPSSTLMGEIADLTYNVVAFSEIMQIIWKRLNDHGKNWRHVYKALVLLEYLIKTGSEKVAQQCRDNLFAIQTLKDFQYFEDSKDQGLAIREKSKMLVNLLKDEEKLKTERTRALKAKERFAQSLSCMGTSLESGDMPRTSSSYHESLSSQTDTSAAAARALNSELESARPQTVGEEELQLQLALAMSKEEAEQEERLRKNDDLRLKLALEESEKLKQQSRSAVDDLLSLNSGPSQPVSTTTTDPWGKPVSNGTSVPISTASLLPSPPNNRNKQPSTDPWGGHASTTVATSAPTSAFDADRSHFDDPWVSNPRSSSALNDPWSGLANANGGSTKINDPWNLTTNGSDENKVNEFDLGDLVEPSKANHSANDSIRRTPESFLGSNSNLVNLDALVSNNNKTQISASASNNPFAATVQAPSNPFQLNKPSQPTINQLRAQSNPLVGAPAIGTVPTSSYSNASALSSLFTGVSAGTVPTNNETSMPILAAGNNLIQTQPAATVWPNFSSSNQSNQFGTSFATTTTTTTPAQQNNPFAM